MWDPPRPGLEPVSPALAGRFSTTAPPGKPYFCFNAGLQLIEWGPPILGRAVCFTQSIDLNVQLIQKHPHRNTQNNVWPNIWAHLWHIKLTIIVLIDPYKDFGFYWEWNGKSLEDFELGRDMLWFRFWKGHSACYFENYTVGRRGWKQGLVRSYCSNLGMVPGLVW